MEHAVHHDDDMPFTPEELDDLHTQDMKAGTYVVGLMLAIFCVGVLLYSIIAVICASG